MPSHYETQIFPYTAQQLFALVADVARYPEFLPWCKAARIVGHFDNGFFGELFISYKGLSESYVSRVTLVPYENIEAVMTEGPFEHLRNSWRFLALENGKTQIDFAIDFKFRSKIMEKMLGGFFSKATEEMITAFKKRADSLYS